MTCVTGKKFPDSGSVIQVLLCFFFFFLFFFPDVSEGEIIQGKRYWQLTHFGSTLPGELPDRSDITDTMSMLFSFCHKY